MKNENKSNKQLLNEIKKLNVKIAEVEKFKTKQKQTEEAIRDSEETFRALIDAISGPAFLLDKNYNFIICNKAMARTFNKSIDDLIGEYAFSLIAPDIAKKRMEYFDKVLKTGNSLSFEDINNDRNFINYIYPVFDVTKKLLKFAVVVIDITEHKLDEEKLKSRNKELETWAEVTGGRELFMLNLKKEINELLEKSGKKPKYKIPI